MALTAEPRGLLWRSSKTFILVTVAIGCFTDLFLYGLVVPILPFMLRDRITVPDDQVQSYVSGLLAAYAGSQVLLSVPAGWLADQMKSRQEPFLFGLAALLGATAMFAFGNSMPVLIIARLLQGVSAAVVWTVGLVMILDTVGPSNLGTAMGTIYSFISVGELVAPVVGGILYEKTGYTGVFGVAMGLLVLDFIMRLLLIERKTAMKYIDRDSDESANHRDGEPENNDATEEDALLPKDDDAAYIIQGEPSSFFRTFPILYCFKNPRLVMSLILSFVQAMFLGSFDATIPTEAKDLFGFSSLEAGLLFIALDIPYLLLGPVAGWAVDNWGTRPAAVIGFGWLAPSFILLRLPSEITLSQTGKITLYCAILSLCGIGMAIIGAPGLVEASNVVQKYEKANPGLFGENGPYAQLYGFNALMFALGLTLGPIATGALRDTIGYGNMNAVLGAIAFVTAISSFFFIGHRQKVLGGGHR